VLREISIRQLGWGGAGRGEKVDAPVMGLCGLVKECYFRTAR